MTTFSPLPAGPIETKAFADPRGMLTFAETGGDLPFIPLRYFIVYDVRCGEVRGTHAHRRCHQFLIALAGEVEVGLDDGVGKRRYLLDRPDRGLFIPAGTWGEQVYVKADSRLLVLASERYDPQDYIVDYEEFLAFRKAQS
jgi:UDP-2-acetamido-3-amino-2,3-dideoxy-glucuronate N-acetyltransferase